MCRRIMLLVVVILLLAPRAGIADSSTKPASPFTDLMKADEFTQCGLNKLNTKELAELNAWIGKTYVALAAASANEPDEISLFDKAHKPVAYVVPKDEMTIYLWSGEPVGYIKDDDVYGFNGKHLGWFDDDRIYDGKGRIVLFTSDAEKPDPRRETAPSIKGLKKLKPLKSLESLAPLKPILTTTPATMNGRFFLMQGQP